MRLITVLICLAALTACAFQPQQAASIEDYCSSVAKEAAWYEVQKTAGVSRVDLKAQVGFTLGPIYPIREILAMHKVIDWVYEGYTPVVVETGCVAQRTDGTWFLLASEQSKRFTL